MIIQQGCKFAEFSLIYFFYIDISLKIAVKISSSEYILHQHPLIKNSEF